MKIVFDANTLTSSKSGVGYYVDGLIRAMSDVGGNDIELVGHYFNFLGKKDTSHLPTAKNIRYIESRFIPGKFLSLCRRLGFQPPYELFTKTRGDILLFPNFVAMPSLFHTKKVTFVHDLVFVDLPEFVAQKNLAFLKKWVPLTIRSAALVVTISNFTKGRIRQEYGIQDGKIYVTPIPPVISQLPRIGSTDRFNIPSKYILFVGTIEPRKNLDTLIAAYEKLPPATQDSFSLVLAGGKGWNDQEILASVASAHKKKLQIILTGYVSDEEKATLYKQAALCVQPSVYEGFGMPVVEAMNYSKAVICSDIEVFREIAGKSVKYFSTKDPDDLANAIDLLLNDKVLLRKFEIQGNLQLKSLPDWHAVATGLLQRLEKV